MIFLLVALLTFVFGMPGYSGGQKSAAHDTSRNVGTGKTAFALEDIMDVLLRDALADLKRKIASPHLSHEEPNSMPAVVDLYLCTQRVHAYFQGFKIAHTDNYVQRTTPIIKQTIGDMWTRTAWIDEEKVNNPELIQFHSYLLKTCKTMGFTPDSKTPVHSPED